MANRETIQRPTDKPYNGQQRNHKMVNRKKHTKEKNHKMVNRKKHEGEKP